MSVFDDDIFDPEEDVMIEIIAEPRVLNYVPGTLGTHNNQSYMYKSYLNNHFPNKWEIGKSCLTLPSGLEAFVYMNASYIEEKEDNSTIIECVDFNKCTELNEDDIKRLSDLMYSSSKDIQKPKQEFKVRSKLRVFILKDCTDRDSKEMDPANTCLEDLGEYTIDRLECVYKHKVILHKVEKK